MQCEEPLEYKNSQKQLPWVEKYRPSSLLQVLAHEEIIQTRKVRKFQVDDRLPNLLLYGQPGTGKTSTIIALAKEMYGKEYSKNVLELNASDERGIQTVRDTIKRFAESQALNFGGKKRVKLIILDEADAMTSAAQFALRRIIEKFSKNTRFCFICNYVSKIIPALQSRCTRFKFKQIPFEASSQKILEICQQEGLKITTDGVQSIFNLCDGDMRRIVNMLQSLSMSLQGSNDDQQIIDSLYVFTYTGMADPKQIQFVYDILMDDDNLKSAYDDINDILINNGVSIQMLLKELNLILLTKDMPDTWKIFLVERLAEIEYRLSLNCAYQFQLQSLVSAFYEMRQVVQD